MPAEGHAVCAPCLGAGRAALCKDTEFGLVAWADAVAGRTGGLPVPPEWADAGRTPQGFPLAPSGEAPADDPWRAALVPAPLLLELLRTPGYETWQGEWWRFCAHGPMVFVGPWGQEEFRTHAAGGDGEALFLAAFDCEPGWRWDDVGASAADPNPDLGVFVFYCPSCRAVRGHLDPG